MRYRQHLGKRFAGDWLSPARIGAVLCVALPLSACATTDRTLLPPETRAGVVCIYEEMKRIDAIDGVGVYVPEGKYPVIAYGFRSRDGHDHTAEIVILGPDVASAVRYRGNYSIQPDNPVRNMAELLQAKCNASGGYVDEVILTGPDGDPYRWRVDMSRYVHHDKAASN